jgi:hypothetical protein
MFSNELESNLESKEDHSYYHRGPAVEAMQHMKDPFSLVHG